MESWTLLVKSALLGTDRHKPGPLAIAPAVDTLITSLGSSTPEHRLLSTAAVLAPYRRAGLTPTQATTSPTDPAPDDPQPPLPHGATERLAMLLADIHAELLPEFLTLTAKAGYRLPARHLPALLDKAADNRNLRPLLGPILGQRGTWLVRLNPKWQFADRGTNDTIEQTWETGSKPARLAAFKQLRAADPARARELLQKSWDQETPEDRAAFVTAMSAGVSAADEHFLEAALDDRRKEVRDAAIELLSSMPTSALVGRMTERATKILTIIVKRGKPTIDVTPPKECDKATTRDGVDVKPKIGRGEKASWVMQILAAVPSSRWSDSSGASPKDLLTAAAHTDWKAALIQGWAAAAARHKDAAWAEVILTHAELDPEPVKRLFASLPSDRADAVLLQLLRDKPESLKGTNPLFTALLESEFPWSEALAREVVNGLRKSIERSRGYDFDWYLSQYITTFARRVPPHLYPEFLENWPKDSKKWEYWSTAVDKFLSVLQFRHEMTNELFPPKKK